MEPVLVLILLPLAIGVGAELIFRDVFRASLVATVTAPAVVYASIAVLDSYGGWNWLASLLVAPLATAVALAAVMACFGWSHARKRPRRRNA